MLGYTEMREVLVWLQLTADAEVTARYDDLSTDEEEDYRTATVRAERHDAYVARLIFDQVEPGRTYRYKILIDGEPLPAREEWQFSTPVLWDYRIEPPAYRMALGSCAYINEAAYDRPGRGYGDKYGIFEAIRQQSPDVMLWLGDNTYLRPADWSSRTGYLQRYTHTRSLPELQPLLAACPHYSIWDDHDFGPNDANGSWHHRETAREVFELFWGNPTTGVSGLDGIMTAFRWVDTDFILLDNRSFRTEQMQAAPEQILGKEQIEWLINQLKYSRSPYKMVALGGQVLNSARVYENHANYEEERAYLLQRLDEEDIRGVIFLTGDRHHSEVSEMTLPGGNKVREFTISPLTSGANQNVTETNDHRVEGSLIQERNFAVLEVSGPRKAREVGITYYNSRGEEIYRFTIAASAR